MRSTAAKANGKSADERTLIFVITLIPVNCLFFVSVTLDSIIHPEKQKKEVFIHFFF